MRKLGDPRAELVRRLLEYEQIKLAAYDLNALPQLDRDYVRTQIFIEQSLVPPGRTSTGRPAAAWPTDEARQADRSTTRSAARNCRCAST
jgi:chromatin segregation and condensation protein Rec8/ScpA/Scc1 (kleisin family)